MSAVLVLNASYEPLNVISLRRAILLLLKEKAEVVEATEAHLRAERLEVTVPSVIRLVTYVPVPPRLPLPVSRRTVMARDSYTCQYCGAQPGKAQLTIDHVVPRSKGGGTTWDNVVAACAPCNRRKGNRSPEAANMMLQSKPERPRYLAFVLLGDRGRNDTWHKYLAIY
jgi:5-methylcytosine-specific restriction endonuclease McrA